jgi:hypothetical protein
MLKKLSDALKDRDDISGCEVFKYNRPDPEPKDYQITYKDLGVHKGRVKNYGIEFVTLEEGNILSGWAAPNYLVKITDKEEQQDVISSS